MRSYPNVEDEVFKVVGNILWFDHHLFFLAIGATKLCSYEKLQNVVEYHVIASHTTN